MDEDRFNMELRKFLKEVGVTSQREVERVVREGAGAGGSLRLRMVLTSPDAPLEAEAALASAELGVRAARRVRDAAAKATDAAAQAIKYAGRDAHAPVLEEGFRLRVQA